MQKRYVYAVLTGLSLTAPALADTPIQTYRFENFSARNRQENCDFEVQSIAENFSAQTGHEIVQASCGTRDTGSTNLDGVITYLAEKPVAMTSTRDRGGSIFNRQGSYASAELCLKDKARAIKQFEEITKLDTLVAYCYRQVSDDYALQIDAIGDSDIKPLTTGTELLGRLVDPAEQFLTQFSLRCRERGVEVRNVGFSGSAMTRRLLLLYYAKKRQDLYNFSELKFASTEECHAGISRLREVFEDYEAPPIAYTCLADISAVRINVITLGSSYLEINGFRHHEMPGNYATHPACTIDIPRVTDILNQDVPGQVIGAICSGKAPEFRMQFFLKPKSQ